MLPLDVSRCVGKLTKVRNKPLSCCVQCERRVWPAGERIVFNDFTPVHKMTEWVCDGRIPYSSLVADAAFSPAGSSNGPAGSV